MDDSSINSLLGAAVSRAVPVVKAVREEQLGDPTPCSGYGVGELLDHLFDIVVNFTRLAQKKPSAFEEAPDYLTTDDWRERFAGAAGRLVAAWGEPGAEEGTTGGMHQPARMVGTMVLLDMTVHVWDLARATGQDFTPDPAGVEVLSGVIGDLAPAARDAGMFDEPKQVAADASRFEAVLAATGRDPGWRPSA
ncbi:MULTISPECIES: TIGR03086 family metal-binding protein [unclassified Streptomyces]|uniref:TIGR03086 family metal-binding protein n=1 Tax=unclassified Streptomyces TaxID=2593676 RepID=UPI001BEAD8B5|nr:MULTISPECIES: TIGR03086 family metal-binding protein [unclassified Streptomyces]MBT2408069.1 TIGR03086 family protein [Streptomyces sp. ISL-21]MBT2455770.1 TIGR03086 family protein [Streptomyces sp. ISL-86]MBT2609519.1 TIGR03086 family protein [Streptomyces sp. ISL-87]